MNLSFGLKQGLLLSVSAMLCSLVACTSDDETVLAYYPKTAEIKDGKLVDYRDGNEYGIAKIGGVYWMTENLRYADSSSTKNLKGNSWCYNNDKKECTKNGRLYSWTAAMDLTAEKGKQFKTDFFYENVQGICPEGWFIPKSSDWRKLLEYVEAHNGGEGSGTSLKSVDGWDEVDSVAAPTNRFGFYGTASGRRNNDGETFMKKGQHAFFWTSDNNDEGTAHGWTLHSDVDALQEGFYYKDHGLSVRCMSTHNYGNVKLDSSYLENIPHNYGTLKYEGEKYRTVKIAELTWMADNMNYEVKGSHCYNDDKDNCSKYGRLYTYEAAKNVCPEGWRLPTSSEFRKLIMVSGSGASLRSTKGWTDKATRGLNFWGFDAKPAGGKENSDYFDLKMSAYFWMNDGSQNDDVVSALWLNYYNTNAEIVNRSTSNEFSVRCVKEEE